MTRPLVITTLNAVASGDHFVTASGAHFVMAGLDPATHAAPLPLTGRKVHLAPAA